MEKKQRFSLRKYKSGTVSVLIGSVFLMATTTVAAEEQVSGDNNKPVPHMVQSDGQASSQEVQTLSEMSISLDLQTADAQSPAETAIAIKEDDKEADRLPAEAIVIDSSSDKSTGQAVASGQSKALPPVNMDIHDWVKTKGAWDKGFKGQGKVIAIIDTGIDASHQAMRITDLSLAKVKSKEEMARRQKTAGIHYGSWVNDKVIFAHNYVENNEKVKEVKFDFEESLEDFDITVDVQRLNTSKRYRPQAVEAPKETVIKIEDIPGVFEIDWPEIDDDSKYESHGMHVTGIATGNGIEPAAVGERFLGIAPEAQVMFMRVFASDLTGTGDSLFVKAIEDAVALGADVINLSLGSANGSHLNGNHPLMIAIEKARQAGVSVVVAAGNERAFGSDHDDPFVTNPDYGLVGSPSTGRPPTSVAAINNKWIFERLMTVEGLENRADLNNGKAIYSESVDFKDIKDSLGYDKPYQYIYVKDLTEDGYKAKNVEGKVVLIERDPKKSFDDMIAQAKKHGALGVLIFNNIPGQANRTMRLSSTGMVLPSAFISHEFGKAMSVLHGDGSGSLVFDSSLSKALSQKGNEMNHFSNWGLTSDGYLKPDITAPGGDIYSTYNDNHYGNQTGTSMASPQIAGASLLVKQYLQQLKPDLPQEQIADLVKNLLMSNAQVHINPITKTTTSPRQQGAGLLNIEAAVSSGLYVTGKDNYGSISLGNVTDTISFEVTVHNLSQETKSLRYETELLTDAIDSKEGRFTLSSRSLKTYQGDIVDIPANGQKTVTIQLDASAFAEELSKQMPNGYYLEGFVRFVDSKNKQHNQINIPFVGFKGAFENLAVVEESIYQLKAQGKKGFYFDESGPKDDIYVGKHFTGLVTLGAETNVSTATVSDNGLHTLGTFRNQEGKFILAKNSQGQPVLAISPNGDNNQDFAAFKGVFLRKYQGLKASVYLASDAAHKEPLWVSPKTFKGDKNFNSDIRFAKSTTLLETEFEGKSLTGAELPDGYYHYVVSYYPDVVGAKRQEMTFELILDRQKPVLGQATFDPATNRFKPSVLEDRGQSGVLRNSVFYLDTKDGKPYTITINDGYKYVSVADNKQFVPRQADGSFILPIDKVSLDDFYYMVEDFAGNRAIAKLGDHLPESLEQEVMTFNLTEGNYQTKKVYDDQLEMAVTDTGLVTNQAHLAVTHRNRPQSHLVKLNHELFISPNGDGNKDFVAFKGVPNKNYQDLQVTVFAKDDQKRSQPIWFSQLGANVSDSESTAWHGVTAGGAKVRSGEYQYVINYRDENGTAHEETHIVTVSYHKPILTQGRFHTVKDVEYFTPSKPQAISTSGIAREEVFYLISKNGRNFNVTEDKHTVIVSDNKVFLPKNEDGSYTIPKIEGVAAANFYYLVEDKAGNVSFTTLPNLREVGQDKGVLSLALDLPILEEKFPTRFTYLVRDADGKPIETLDYFNNSANSLILPFGHYTVELLTYDTNLLELQFDKVLPFTLTAENDFQHIDFKMTKLASGQVTVHFDNLLPAGSQVSLRAPQGHLIPLNQSLYVPRAYGKMVQAGTYELVVSLPKGYHIDGETKVLVQQNDVHELAVRLVPDSAHLAVSPAEKDMSALANIGSDYFALPTMADHVESRAKSAGVAQLPRTGDKTMVKWSAFGFLILTLSYLFSRKKDLSSTD